MKRNAKILSIRRPFSRFLFIAGAAALTWVSLAPSSSHGAPMPGTSSSTLVSPQLGLYRSPLGFELSAGASGWAHAEPPKNNKFVATLYANQKTGASLSVRVDEIKKEVPLDKYIQRWVKEYPKYGFDVIGSQAFAQNKQHGYVVDLINRDTGKQLRQVLFMKKQRAVIMTCRDSVKNFKQSLKDCNQIIRTFSWNE
jgi:hypothetical protein